MQLFRHLITFPFGLGERKHSSKVIFGLELQFVSNFAVALVLPLRKWCVRLLGKYSRQGKVVLTVLSGLEHIKATIEGELPSAPYFDIIRNPKL